MQAYNIRSVAAAMLIQTPDLNHETKILQAEDIKLHNMLRIHWLKLE